MLKSNQMATTLNIDDATLAEVKKFAEEGRLSLDEAATRLIHHGAATLPRLKTKNGWVVFESIPGSGPLNLEIVKGIAGQEADEEFSRAFSPGR